MAGNGRNIRLLPAAMVGDDIWPDCIVAWVPILDLPWRDDEQDRIQTETERTAS